MITAIATVVLSRVAAIVGIHVEGYRYLVVHHHVVRRSSDAAGTVFLSLVESVDDCYGNHEYNDYWYGNKYC